MKVDGNVTPVIKPQRNKKSVAMEKCVKKKFDKGVEKEVISPVSEPT